MSETRTIRLTAAQWRVVESALMRAQAAEFAKTFPSRSRIKQAGIALDKIRAAKGAK